MKLITGITKRYAPLKNVLPFLLIIALVVVTFSGCTSPLKSSTVSGIQMDAVLLPGQTTQIGPANASSGYTYAVVRVTMTDHSVKDYLPDPMTYSVTLEGNNHYYLRDPYAETQYPGQSQDPRYAQAARWDPVILAPDGTDIAKEANTTGGWQPGETCTWYEVYQIPIGQSATGWNWNYDDGQGRSWTATL